MPFWRKPNVFLTKIIVPEYQPILKAGCDHFPTNITFEFSGLRGKPGAQPRRHYGTGRKAYFGYRFKPKNL